MGNIRAGLRIAGAVVGGFAIAGLALVQGFVVGPLTRNYNTIPNMMYQIMRKVMGYKVEFNAASAPIEKNKQVWFLANHMAVADFVVAGVALKGAFIGKGDILKWPGIAQIAKSAKFMGVRRKSEFNGESRGKIAKNFNDGYNAIMFPEGTTSDGREVKMFRAALLTLLYGETATDKKNRPVTLNADVVVQPVAIRVKSVNGQDATNNDELRNMYSMTKGSVSLRDAWNRMKLKSTVLELTVFPPLKPTDFPTAIELANQAARDVASVVNPGQTVFERAAIPARKAKL